MKRLAGNNMLKVITFVWQKNGDFFPFYFRNFLPRMYVCVCIYTDTQTHIYLKMEKITLKEILMIFLKKKESLKN